MLCWHQHVALQIWEYDQPNNKLRTENVRLGNLQRQFRSLEVDEHDRYAYAGSTTGDVLQVRPGVPAGVTSPPMMTAAGVSQGGACRLRGLSC